MLLVELEEIKFDRPEAGILFSVICVVCNKYVDRFLKVRQFTNVQVGCKDCGEIRVIELTEWIANSMHFDWGYSDEEIDQVMDVMTTYHDVC
jgi:hypothetical protein